MNIIYYTIEWLFFVIFHYFAFKLNNDDTLIFVKAETQIECPGSDVGSRGPKKHRNNSQ